MGGLSFFTTSHFLVSDQVNAAISETRTAAINLEKQLGQQPPPSPIVVSSLVTNDNTSGSTSVLYYGGNEFDTTFVQLADIPAQLRALVRSGTPATQNVVLNNNPQVIVGIPLPAVHAHFYAIFDLHDLNHTLHVLALGLALGGLVTTVLGGVIGRLASGRSLRPLTAVSRAAVAIAGGDLDTRLRARTEDPDLTGLTRSFNTMVDQLQERIERDARFTSDVSHELRSPLTTLANTLNVLEAHAEELSPRARRALELLEISRSDTGSADMSLEYVDAGELVRQAVHAGGRGLTRLGPPPTVSIDPLLDDVLLHVDKRRFERVMANLLENAAHYGGGATRVAAEPGADPTGKPTVVVAVEDNGPGVPVDERRRIFDRFYRGQAAGRRGASTGTGLGLALVAEHVRLLGGVVGIEETPGGGARFTVELPALDGEDPS